MHPGSAGTTWTHVPAPQYCPATAYSVQVATAPWTCPVVLAQCLSVLALIV